MTVDEDEGGAGGGGPTASAAPSGPSARPHTSSLM